MDMRPVVKYLIETLRVGRVLAFDYTGAVRALKTVHRLVIDLLTRVGFNR